MMMVLVVTAAAMAILMAVMMLQLVQMLFQLVLALHSFQQLRAGQFRPGSGHQRRVSVVLPKQGNSSVQLGLGDGIGTGEDDGAGGFDLVVVELAEVLHIHLHLAGIRYRYGIPQRYIIGNHLFHSRYHIAELAYAGGLDNDTVRTVLLDHLGQRLTKIAHQAAANAAGVHLGNIDACILQETAVNTDLTEFIFDQHQLLTAVGLLDHFLDQRGLTGAEKTGVNINFCHGLTFFLQYFSYYTTENSGLQQKNLIPFANEQRGFSVRESGSAAWYLSPVPRSAD